MALEKSSSNQKKTALQQWLKRKKGAKAKTGILPKPPDQPALLSYGQQRLWVLQQLNPDNPFYHYAHRYHFRGKLNREHLENSFQQVVRKHTVLQTSFREENGQTVQLVDSEMKIPFEWIDCREVPAQQMSDN